jgi:[protein-PII] uridylyltransferase
VAEAQHEFFARMTDWDEETRKDYAARHYEAYWLGTSTEKQLRHARLISEAAPKSVVTGLETDAFTAITELTVYTPDHPRLLALITGACAAAGANIAGAQIFTTTDGMALDTILIQREFPQEEDERLILPGTAFHVKSHLALGGGLTMIQLEEDRGCPPLISGFAFAPTQHLTAEEEQERADAEFAKKLQAQLQMQDGGHAPHGQQQVS